MTDGRKLWVVEVKMLNGIWRATVLRPEGGEAVKDERWCPDCYVCWDVCNYGVNCPDCGKQGESSSFEADAKREMGLDENWEW